MTNQVGQHVNSWNNNSQKNIEKYKQTDDSQQHQSNSETTSSKKKINFLIVDDSLLRRINADKLPNANVEVQRNPGLRIEKAQINSRQKN